MFLDSFIQHTLCRRHIVFSGLQRSTIYLHRNSTVTPKSSCFLLSCNVFGDSFSSSKTLWNWNSCCDYGQRVLLKLNMAACRTAPSLLPSSRVKYSGTGWGLLSGVPTPTPADHPQILGGGLGLGCRNDVERTLKKEARIVSKSHDIIYVNVNS